MMYTTGQKQTLGTRFQGSVKSQQPVVILSCQPTTVGGSRQQWATNRQHFDADSQRPAVK